MSVANRPIRPDRRRCGAALAGLLALQGCAPAPSDTGPFEDVTARVGLDFVHRNGMSGRLYIAEMMGPGVALFDYDGDGDLDIYFPQGRMLDPAEPDRPSPDRLYRNDLSVAADGSRRLRFTDVTDRAGLVPSEGYTFGVAVGDVDGDGRLDLYVTELGANRLLYNVGDGTFRDITAESGTAERRWSMPALFFDYDGDGATDLYVGNYLDFRVATHRDCRSPSGRPDYCGPLSYGPLSDRLFRNRGDGSFEDATLAAGLASHSGNALGAIAADIDLDGRLDLYVANDTGENQLWLNAGDGSFREQALVAGCALNASGEPEGSMGVDAGDVDGDGDLDLVLTHMSHETDTLFVNDGTGRFEDESMASGIGRTSRGLTGFGAGWLDYDNDGDLDLAVANGEIKAIDALVELGDPFPLHQRNQLLRNLGDGRFEEVEGGAADPFAISEVSRGLALGDLDNDGDIDIVVANNNGPARLLLNRIGQDGHWLGIDAGDGARVELEFSDGTTMLRHGHRSGSYLSSSDPRVLFGLGTRTDVDAVRVTWPDGTTERRAVEGIDRYLTLRPGGA